MKTKTSATKTVTIRVVDTGTNYACCAKIMTLNGRVLATTGPRPHGMRHAAYEDAKALAERNGWIASDEEA